MDIQEINNITVSDVKIKVERFEESSSVNKPSSQIMLSEINGKEVIDEQFDESICIIPEEIHIKNEVQEEDQFKINMVNEREIKDEYFDVPESIAYEDIVIKTEVQEEGRSNKYGESITKKGEKRYCCDNCNYETQRKGHMVRHMRIHNKVNARKYSWNRCQKDLSRPNCFGLSCVLCLRSFNGKASLDAHYVSKHPEKSEKWGSIITHKIYECTKCIYKTVITSHFKYHLATHGTPTGHAQFKCNICGYKVIRKSSFMRHLRLHDGQLPFVCTECDKKFNTKIQLDGHIIFRHSENKELISSVTSKIYQCEKCSYKTVRNFNFTKHLKRCL